MENSRKSPGYNSAETQAGLLQTKNTGRDPSPLAPAAANTVRADMRLQPELPLLPGFTAPWKGISLPGPGHFFIDSFRLEKTKIIESSL